MSGVAGYKAQLKLGGVPTTFTNENLTELKVSSNNGIYRIATPIKRVLSSSYPLVILDNDNDVITPNNINYLEGVIVINNVSSYSLPFKISGKYIPLLYIGGSKEYSIEIGGDVLDNSSFHSEDTLSPGFREKVCGIHDISVSFSRWNDFSNALTTAKLNKTPVFVSINPGASSSLIKGWFQIETDSLSGDIGSLEEQALCLVLCGNNSQTYFSYSFNKTDGEAMAMTYTDLYNNFFLM